MSKKSVLIYYSIFNIGGAERSILKLINNFVDNNVNVELLLVTKGGSLENQLNNQVKKSYLRSGDFGTKAKKNNGIKKIYYLLRYIISRIEQEVKGFFFKFKKYDAVFIGLHGLSPMFCLENIKAKKYFQFIRSDLKMCDTHQKAHKHILKYGDKIDKYLCVSQTALDSFNFIYPQLNEKSLKIYNFLEEDNIINLSKQTTGNLINKENNFFTILTICRLQEKSKGLLRMLDVLYELKLNGKKVKWYLIGDGPDKNLILKKIKDLDLENDMILLGRKENPYPFFLEADLIAVLSFYEGLCGVVNEAKILRRPLITTEFSGVFEQIENKVNGLIVKNDYQSIVEGLNYILNNTSFNNSLAINNLPEEIINDKHKMQFYLKLIS
jgi:glycosyltransferase involved in cell wall biosynthesis